MRYEQYNLDISNAISNAPLMNLTSFEVYHDAIIVSKDAYHSVEVIRLRGALLQLSIGIMSAPVLCRSNEREKATSVRRSLKRLHCFDCRLLVYLVNAVMWSLLVELSGLSSQRHRRFSREGPRYY
jgi:hypothetical protein